MRFTRSLPALACAAALGATAWAATDDTDALNLQSAAVNEAGRKAPYRLFVEGAAGRVEQRNGLPSFTAKRLSLDYAQSFKLGNTWQFGVSDRVDWVDPADAGTDKTLNSLRELYVSRRNDSATTIFELGRVNVRHGPAYGYNPTDYFRTFAVRAATTVDPFALRENRMGTVMLRAQRLWSGGSASLALAPKLDDDGPSRKSFDLDLGATNSRNRYLATVSARSSDKLSGEVLLYGEEGKRPQLGINATALLSDAVVAHAEWSRGEDDDLLAVASGASNTQVTRSRASAGLTLSLTGQVAITAEYEYNGFAGDVAAWAGSSPVRIATFGRYLVEAQRRQDNAARKSWLLYATQKSVIVKNLDATALLRVNADDHSKLGWIEMRYHWPGIDAAVQFQTTRGKSVSQYGLPPAKQSVQLLAAWYF